MALTLASCTQNNKENDTLKIGIAPTNPPYSYLEKDKLNGFEIDVNKEIAKKLNKKPEFLITNFNNLIPSLNDNKFDMIDTSNVSTEEKRKIADLSAPYYSSNIAIISRKNNPIDTKADLANKKIAVRLGSTPEVFAKTNFKGNNLIISKDDATSMKLLKDGEVDAVIIDSYSGAMINSKENCCIYKITEEMREEFVIAVKKDSPLLPKINKALEELKEDGTIDSLRKKWFSDVEFPEDSMLK